MIGSCWTPCGNHVGVFGALLWIAFIIAVVAVFAWLRSDG